MALNLNLHLTKKVPLKTILEISQNLGFVQQKKGKYFWYKTENHQSLTGVFLHYNLKQAGKHDKTFYPPGVKLVLNASTPDYRSLQDLKMQNQVIQNLQQILGGKIYNPQTKTNDLLSTDLPDLKPVEKKLGQIWLDFKKRLEITKTNITQVDLDQDDSFQILNLWIPYLVSLWENYWYENFVALLDFKPQFLEKIMINRGRYRLTYWDLKTLYEQEKTLSQIEAENYSFQNLPSINAAFLTILDLSLERNWGKQKLVNSKLSLEQVLKEVLFIRHKIIHRAYIEQDLSKTKIDSFVEAIEKSAQILVDLLEKKGYRLTFEKHLAYNPKKNSNFKEKASSNFSNKANFQQKTSINFTKNGKDVKNNQIKIIV